MILRWLALRVWGFRVSRVEGVESRVRVGLAGEDWGLKGLGFRVLGLRV